MQRRLGSKIQRGILDCLIDEEMDITPGKKIRNIGTIVDYLLTEGYIKHPDRRKKDYNKKMRQVYISVCRSIRNLAKGDEPIVKIKKYQYTGHRKRTRHYRYGRRKITDEYYQAIWFKAVELIK